MYGYAPRSFVGENIMHQVVKGASPGIQIRYSVINFNLEEDISGIYAGAQLPIIKHIKKDRLGAGNTNDKSN